MGVFDQYSGKKPPIMTGGRVGSPSIKAPKPKPDYTRVGLAAQAAWYKAAAQNEARQQNNPVNTPSAPVAAQSPGMPTGIDLDKVYADLITKVRGMNDVTQKGYDESATKVKGFYDKASKEMYDEYKNSRAVADAAAAGVFNRGEMNVQGVVTGAPSIYAGRDANLRRIEENSNQSLADHQAFFEKMRGAKGASLDVYLSQLESDKVAQQMAQQQQILAYLASQKKASGGSGRGGGGGSSSGSSTATEVMTQFDPDVVDVINSITDPRQRAAMLESYMQNQTYSPIIKGMSDQINQKSANLKAVGVPSMFKSPNFYEKNPGVGPRPAGYAATVKNAKKEADDLAMLIKNRNLLLSNQGLFGGASTKNTVTTRGRG
jgi:hypothetical protein